MQTKVQKITLAGMLTAVGILLPLVTAHGFGIKGNVLLPMYFPVVLAGCMGGPGLGVLCGILIPVLNSALTGMPAAYPMLPMMIGDLCIYGLVSGLLYKKLGLERKKAGIYVSMAGGMLCGRIAYGFIFALLTLWNGPVQALSAWAAIVAGVPGMILQFVLVPLIILAVKHSTRTGEKNSGEENVVLEEAVRMVKERKASCVVIKGNQIVKVMEGRGIAPVISLYEQGVAENAQIVDKIIGKAAAMILVLAGVKEIYGETMSTAARDYLERHQIKVSYGRCIDVITNREGKGICPMERAVMDLEDPEEALAVLKETLERLQKMA